MAKFTVPMAVTFDAQTYDQAQAMLAELDRLTKETAVKIAIQGAAIRCGVQNPKTLVGPPERIG